MSNRETNIIFPRMFSVQNVLQVPIDPASRVLLATKMASLTLNANVIMSRFALEMDLKRASQEFLTGDLLP